MDIGTSTIQEPDTPETSTGISTIPAPTHTRGGPPNAMAKNFADLLVQILDSPESEWRIKIEALVYQLKTVGETNPGNLAVAVIATRSRR